MNTPLTLESIFMNAFMNTHGQLSWFALVGVCFSIAFLIIGISRVIEFSGIGLRPMTRSVLIPIHILGCFSFAAAIALNSIELHERVKALTTVCFFSGFFTLVPIHIFIGLKRRIKLTDSLGTTAMRK